MRWIVIVCVLTSALHVRCGGEPRAEPERAATLSPGQDTTSAGQEPAVEPPADPLEQNVKLAREQVEIFIENVRIEEYQEAYDACSYILKQSYSYQQFLMAAGKLQMEELPCVTDEDVRDMEPVEGHVGLGPKDILVSGFLVTYRCPGDQQDRALTVYLDFPPNHIVAPLGVASFFFP